MKIQIYIDDFEQCCDVIELNLVREFANRNPDGKYKKQGTKWNDKVVYHNTESTFYIYYSVNRHTWIVSVLI